jgi:transcriptional regulator with XRE-family HTH domain/tetratricopeptide (TPR) repeat protein
VSTPTYPQALGRKIAAERRRRGLSQPELARLIGRSVAWVSQVERGVRKVDRMSVLETVAVALDVPLAELAAEAPVVAAVTEEPPGAGGLRLVLSGAYALRAMLDGRRPPAVGTLRTKSRKAWELTHAGRYTELTDLLRGLIPDLETAARALPEAQRGDVFQLMASTYQACSAALDKLREPEAAWIAADRAMASAERAGNPMLVAAGAFRLVFVFLTAHHYGQAEETARTTADALQARADQGEPEAISLWGALTLQRAVIASRVNDPDAAYGHLEQAAEIAGRLGEGRNDYNTEFGPANVGLYEIAVAVELGDAGRALRTAAAVDTTGLSAERRARMLIDVARAHAQRRQVTEAAAALRQAEEITPEQVREHELVYQLVSDLLTMQDPPSGELRELAVRVGATRLSKLILLVRLAHSKYG